MRDVVIDLGEVRRDETAPEPGQPPSYRSLLTFLTVLLLASLAAAVPLPRPVQPILLPARLGDAMIVERNRLHVVGAGDSRAAMLLRDRMVTTYLLPEGRRLSRTSVVATGSVSEVTSVAGVLLVSYQVDTLGSEATVAVVAGTRRELWRVPARLMYVSRDAGVAVFHWRSPSRGTRIWYGIDLRSGQRKWTVEQPLGGSADLAAFAGGFPRRLVTAVDGRLEVRDTLTGDVVAAAEVPTRGFTMHPAGDLVLIGGTGGLRAYGLGDLRQRWTSTRNLDSGWVEEDCAGLICLIGWQGGVHALDPATGIERWAGARWTTVTAAGAAVLVTGTDGDEGRDPLVVLDPATGAPRGDFGRWRPAGPPGAGGRVLALQREVGTDVVRYGLLDPATLRVALLGAATGVSGECSAAAAVLVCRRLDDEVGIWPLTGS